MCVVWWVVVCWFILKTHAYNLVRIILNTHSSAVAVVVLVHSETTETNSVMNYSSNTGYIYTRTRIKP